MDIVTAVKQAAEQNKYFTRRFADGIVATKIKATNSHDCCYLLDAVSPDRKPGRCWNPTLDDLLSDEWEVVD